MIDEFVSWDAYSPKWKGIPTDETSRINDEAIKNQQRIKKYPI